MPGAAPGEADQLEEAVQEMQAALEALRRAQSHWVGARAFSGGKAWDMTLARRALEEAESRLHAARVRLDLALAMARRRELRNGTQD